MPVAPTGFRGLSLLGVLLAMLLMGGLWMRSSILSRQQPSTMPSTRAAVAAATRSTTHPAAIPAPRSLVDVLSRTYTHYPTTQPLGRPLTLGFAGHFLLHDPVYLDHRGCLWITRHDAEPTATVLASAARQVVQVTRERVQFVHWRSTESGDWNPVLIRLNAGGDGYELVSVAGAQPIGQGTDYDWARAFSWDEKIVVPTDVGVSVFTISGSGVAESPSPALADKATPHAAVQIAFYDGPIAWIPPQRGHGGSEGVVRFVEKAWFRLGSAQGWPGSLLHLVPLLDGTVLQLIRGEGETVKLNVVRMEAINPEEQKTIASLIGQLSDPDPEKRQAAYKHLTRYGPSLWPIAERMMETEGPEAKARLKDLLRAKATPLLGGMQLLGNKLHLASRYPDGGAVFYAEQGVSIPRGDEEPQTLVPAWLSIRPGRPVELLPRDLVQDLDPANCIVTPWYDDWIVTDEIEGPRRFIGGGSFLALLRPDERAYWHFVGIDQEGRYLFRKPPRSGTPASRPMTDPAAATATDQSTLIVDPKLPDPTPRLPVWHLEYPDGEVGWDREQYPAAKAGGGWSLRLSDWHPIDEDQGEPFFTRADQIPPIASPSDPAAPTSAPAANPLDRKPLLADPEGSYYFDGRTRLKVVQRDGTVIDWPLPATAAGDADCDVHLVRTGDGTLFLYNKPGRMLRIRPARGGPDPFQVEATFVRGIPESAHPTRLWLDPLGRICMAYDGNRLAIFFPQGYIPPETAQMMTPEQLEAAE